MDIRNAVVYLRREKLYLAPTININNGPFLEAGPVFTTTPEIESIAHALEDVLNVPIVPPILIGYRNYISPVLEAAKVRSWRQLVEDAAYCQIVKKEVYVINRWQKSEDKRGGFILASGEARTEYLLSTPITQLAEYVLSALRKSLEG